MRANRLPAGRGLRWIGEAFVICRAAPVRLLLLNLAFLFAVTFAVALPVIGFALIWVLIPALVVGPHAMSRAAARGALPGPELLIAGFHAHAGAQLRLGGVYLAAMMAVLAATVLADGGQFAQAMIGRTRLEIADLQKPELLQAMMIGAALQSAMLAALWYAPLLVAWNGLPVSKAVFFSAAASLINWRAFIAYGAAITLLFALVLMLALGAAMLFSGPRAAQGNAALFAVIWTLLPVWFAASYLSYRDVFGEVGEGSQIPYNSPP